MTSTSFGQCDLVYDLDSIPATCNGACDGVINISFINNGTNAAPYNAIFENSFGVTVGTHTFFGEFGSTAFTTACAGTYTVTLQSILTPSCSYQTTMVVTEPTAVSISSVNVIHEADGLANGSLTINATGGNPPYQYSINNGASFQGSNNFTGLAAGVYYTVVQDANGCETTELISVGLIASTGCEVVAGVAPQSTTCFGLCDGEILVDYENLQMGTPGSPYNVTIEDSDGSPIGVQNFLTETQSLLFSGVCAVTYTITIQGTSCSFIIPVPVLSAPAMTVYANTTPPTFGLSNGDIELFVIGGVPPFQYSINNGSSYQASPYFDGLAEGIYPGLVQDANGCTQPLDIPLTDFTACNVSVNANAAIAPSCFGICDGTINYSFNDIYHHGTYIISLQKGNVPVQTSIYNSISGIGDFENICAGNYNVVVTDIFGCTTSSSVILNQPTQVLISNVITTDADPFMNNGTATIIATGGQAPYTYSLNGTNYFSSNIFTDLPKGIHVAYVLDANGCEHELTFIVQKNGGCDFNIVTTSDSSSCAGTCDGVLNYSFNGSTSDTPFSIVLENSGNVIETDVSANVNVSDSFTGLCPGTYFLTIGNSSGCEHTVVTVISQPPILDVFATPQTASTGNADGGINVLVSGGSMPYQYSADNQTNWQSTSTFNGLSAGNYTVWVKDTNECLGIFSVEIKDTSSCSFIVNATATPTNCVNNCNGKLVCTFIDVNVNPPFSMHLYQGITLIDSSNIFTNYSGTHQFTDLCQGGYTVVVTDADGCKHTKPIYIHGASQILVDNTLITNATVGNSDGDATILVSGGTAPYEFTIDNGVTWQTQNLFDNLSSGYYITMIKDANDCILLHGFNINEEPGCNILTTFVLSQPISCHDTCDAIISYSFFEAVSTPPYFIELVMNSGAVFDTTLSANTYSSIWDSLCPGVFSISVTNGNGCTSFMPSLIISKPMDIFLDGTITNISTGQSNGAIDLNSWGGTGQHLYSIDNINFQSLNSFQNFSPGTYLATVIDENNCTDTMQFIIGANPNCDIQVAATAGTMLDCTGDCNGYVSWSINDANTNPPYSILLTNAAGATVDAIVDNNSNASGFFSNLCADDYFVNVTDANGCQSENDFFTIVQPDFLVIDTDLVHPTDGFYNGSITINPSGGTGPYQYSTNNQVTWTSTNTLTNLGDGFYIIYVKDANGCVQVVCIVLADPALSSIVELIAEISVYPNPTQGIVFVQSKAIQTVAAYDLSGKRIQLDETVAINGVALDMTNLSRGVYLIEITTTDGEILHIQVVKN